MAPLIQNIIRIFSFTVLVLFSFGSIAEEVSPYIVLKNTGDKLFTRIASSQQELEKFPELMRDIVDEELMPNVDYKYASYMILGKNLKHTTKEQRAKFVESMRHYLVRTYATALSKYENQQVTYEHDKPTKGKKIVMADAIITAPDQPDITITFKMRQNKKTKEWKAYDMVVEGISLLNTKKAELSRRIAKQGVEQVTIELAALSK